MGSNSSLFYNNPLFSSVITLFLLIFLYFPNCLIKSILYPILISTLILLLSILRLGVSQQKIKHQNYTQFNNNIFESVSQFEFELETLLQDSNTKIEPKSITFTKVPISLELEHELESEQQVITLTKIDPRLEPKPITLTKDVIEPVLEFSTFTKDLIEPESTTDLIEPRLETFTLTKDLIEPETITVTKDLVEPESSTLTGDLIEPESIRVTKDLIEPESIRVTKDLIEPESTTLNKESVTKIESNQDEIDVDPHYNATQPELMQLDPSNKPESYHKENFVEWDLWGPLEVIYEEEETQNETLLRNVERYPSLSKYYPESDTGSDTDTESSSCSLDEEFEGMFEIALDYGVDVKNNNGNLLNKVNKEVEFDEEDNLIEIDISHSKEENKCVFSS